jgi:hypothetical protein
MSLMTLPTPTVAPTVGLIVRKKLKDARSALPVAKRQADRASYHMLNLYRTNLEVRLRCIDEATLQSNAQKNIFQVVTEMLKAPCPTRATGNGIAWDDVYKIERMIVLLYSGAQLRQEIKARLQELASESPNQADVLSRQYEAMLRPSDGSTAADEAMLRTFLVRVMEAVHWNAKKKYLSRPIRKEATKSILSGMLVSFLLMVLPYVIINFGSAKEIGSWWSLFALYTALTAGLMGAFFSRLIDVQRHWGNFTLDEVYLHRELSYMLLRAGVGVCGALIVYFFLRSEFVSGPLFPNFVDVAIRYVVIDADKTNSVGMTFVMPSKDLALLTFWCFLAGFSEALVPSILASTEKQLSEAGTAPRGGAK